MTARVAACRDIVLLHGWGMAKSVWDDVGRLLAPYYRVTTLDLPGYGDSDSCTPYTPECLVERLAMQAPQRCLLMGWSLGGQIALQWAMQYPEQVTRLALIASTPRFVSGVDWPHGIDVAVLDEFAAHLRTDPESTLARFALLQAKGDREARAVARELRMHTTPPAKCAPEALAGGLAALRDNDLRWQLQAVKQPALILQGEADSLVPWGAAEYLRAMLPRARLAMLPGAAHAPLLSAAGTIAREVISFLHE